MEDVDAIVPEVWPFEIANGIFVAYSKRKRITEADIYEYVKLLESQPAYLDLALRERLPLATSDEELKKAALIEGVALI